MGEHPIAQQIVDILNRHGFWYDAFEHEPVRTSQDAANIRDSYSMKQGAKSLIVRVKPVGQAKQLVMLVLPGDKQFDSDKVKKLFNTKDIRFATEAEIDTITNGIKPGGLPPFGNLFNLQVVSDPTLFDNEKIVFNAGRNFSIAIESEDYKQLVDPTVVDIIS
ncbi:MAG TPA: YbaK/EbsC family protein [Candidatus Saccharimonadales bacterium]|nr:YbaK/EbsC family protein [Candidatus Saccharimonadales bacterium]